MDLHKIFQRLTGRRKEAVSMLPAPRPPETRPTIPSAPSDLEKNAQSSFEQPVIDEMTNRSDLLQTDSGKATLRAVEELLGAVSSQEQSLDQAIREDTKKQPEPPSSFFLHNGGELRSVDDLAEAAKNMSDEVFFHHVREDANDFANWIEHSLGQPETAARIRQAQDPQQLTVLLLDDSTPLPDIKQEDSEPEDLPVDDLVALRQHFVHLRDDINSEIDESISLLHTQGERIASLRDEVKASSEDLATREAQLRNELERLRSEQEGLREEIEGLKVKNKELLDERKDAKAVQEEVRQIREQLRSKHEELLSARRLLKQQLQERGVVQAQQELLQEEAKQPSKAKYHPSSEHLRALIQTVREDISANRWSAARHGYNDARNAFYKASTLDADERHELHQDIMDLYTQINLHEMN